MKTLWKILGIGMLVAILGSVTLGSGASARIDFAGRSEHSAEDCDALGLRLREMIKNGELTREEAGEMLEGLRWRMAVAERQR